MINFPTKLPSRLAALLGAAALSACGGGVGQTGNEDAGSVAGIYQGLLVSNGASYQLVGLVDANGNARFVESTTGTPLALIVPSAPLAPSTNGAFTLGFTALALNDTVLDNGASSETGTITGTVVTGDSIQGSFTDSGEQTGTVTLNFDSADYDRPAALTIIGPIAYGFSYVSGGQTYTGSIVISNTGSFTGTDTQNCQYNGSVSVPNPARNLYAVTINDSCSSGGTLSGLGTFFPATSTQPAKFEVAANNSSFGIATVLTATGAAP